MFVPRIRFIRYNLPPTLTICRPSSFQLLQFVDNGPCLASFTSGKGFLIVWRIHWHETKNSRNS